MAQTEGAKRAIHRPEIFFHTVGYRQASLTGVRNVGSDNDSSQSSHAILITLKGSPIEWMGKYETQRACLSKQYLVA